MFCRGISNQGAFQIYRYCFIDPDIDFFVDFHSDADRTDDKDNSMPEANNLDFLVDSISNIHGPNDCDE